MPVDLQPGWQPPTPGGSQTSPHSGSVVPLPHTCVDLHVESQPLQALAVFGPLSQTSPHSLSTTLLPHDSFDMQSDEQPWHLPLFAPRSQTSPRSITPLPH